MIDAWRNLSSDTRRSCFVAIVVFFAALLWPVSMLWELPLEHASRWLKNELTFSLAHLFLFPLAFGVAFYAFDWDRAKQLPRIHLAILVAMGVIAVSLALNDAWSRTLEPYELHDEQSRDRAFQLELDLRKSWAAKEPNQSDKKQESMSEAEKEYLILIRAPSESNQDSVFLRVNLIKVVKISLNLIFALGVIFVYWYYFVSYFFSSATSPHAIQPVIDWRVPTALLILYIPWVPMRLYTDWYQHYFTPNLKQSSLGPAALPLAVLILTLILFLLGVSGLPDRLKKIVRGVISVIPHIGMAILLLYFRTLADYLAQLPLPVFFIAGFSLGWLFLNLVVSLFREGWK